MMTTEWFSHCRTPDEARLEYRRLCFEHHPDHGGSTFMMQAVNAAYERWKAERLRARPATSRRGWQRPQRQRPADVAPEHSRPEPEPERQPLHLRATVLQLWQSLSWQPEANGNWSRALGSHRAMLVQHPAPKYKGAWFVLIDDSFSPYFYDNRVDAENAAFELIYEKVKFEPL